MAKSSTKVGKTANRSWQNRQLCVSGKDTLKDTTKDKELSDKSEPSLLLNKQVRRVFASLKERRGYEQPNRMAEARAMRWMLGQGYTPDDILGCYDHLKAQDFWRKLPLTMLKLQGQIGEWKQHKQPAQDGEWRFRG